MILENTHTHTSQVAEILPMGRTILYQLVQNHFPPHIRTQKLTFPEHVNWYVL